MKSFPPFWDRGPPCQGPWSFTPRVLFVHHSLDRPPWLLYLACRLRSCGGTRVRVPDFPDPLLTGSSLNRQMSGRQQDRPQRPLPSLGNVAHAPVAYGAPGGQVSREDTVPLFGGRLLSLGAPGGCRVTVHTREMGDWESWARQILDVEVGGHKGF